MRISDWSSDVCSSDLFGGGALSAHDQNDRRAQPRVGHAESDGFMDQARCDRDILDLGRADAVARSLDHRVVAADEKEQAIGISADGVARPDRSEEHTSELQSLMRISYAVFCLKKKTKTHNIQT